MPALAVDAWRILIRTDLHQRRIVALMGGSGMDVQFAELAAEGEMLLWADVLVAKKDHEIFGERAMDLVHLAVGARVVGNELADIDARYFRADDRRELFDADGLKGLALVGGMPIARSLLAGQRGHRKPPSLFSAIVARMERSAIRDQPNHWREGPGVRFAPSGLHACCLLLRRRRWLDASAVTLLDIIDHQRLEVGGNRRSAERAEFLAVDEHRRSRGFAGAGQRDADIGVLGFAGAVDDAAHDRDVERLDAGILRLPGRHLVADEILDRARQFLEGGRGGAAAAGACRDQRHEGAETHGLQQLRRDLPFHGAIAAGLRGERNPDMVSDAAPEQKAERSRRGHDALRAPAAVWEAKVARVIR